VINICKTVF